MLLGLGAGKQYSDSCCLRVTSFTLKRLISWIFQYGLRSTAQTRRLWLVASIGFSVLYGVLFWHTAFDGTYSMQDDARQHVFWMLRYVEPSLFPDDVIADYFQSVAPVGYKVLYRLGALGGIHPFLLNKLLPPLIGVVATFYIFELAIAIIPVPLVAFVSTLILNQAQWMWDELPSGTPKAFSILLIVAFLVYVARRSRWGVAIVIALQGLIYPHLVFISVLVLALGILWPGQNRRQALLLWGTGTAAAVAVLLPYVLATSPYGPVVTLEQAKAMAEFRSGGRNAFFFNNWGRYWLFSGRSGLLPPIVPVTIGLALALPLLRWRRLLLTQKITRHGALLLQLGIASGVMFFLSHGVLFRLHLPSRYSRHSLKVIVAIGAAIVLVALLEAGLRRLSQPSVWWKQGLGLLLILGFTVATAGYPALLDSFINAVYIRSPYERLYTYLQQQPADIKVASLASEAENIPAFAARSVLFSRGHSLAYHQGYYGQIRPRILAVLLAQYSPDVEELRRVIRTYDIDFWLLEDAAFNPEVVSEQWFRQFKPETAAAVAQLRQQTPAIQRLLPQCEVLRDLDQQLVSADCLLTAKVP